MEVTVDGVDSVEVIFVIARGRDVNITVSLCRTLVSMNFLE